MQKKHALHFWEVLLKKMEFLIQVIFEISICCKTVIIPQVVQRIRAIYQYNFAKNGKGLKIGTKGADTI